MDDIDFSLPVGEMAKYGWANASCAARQVTAGGGIGFRFSASMNLRRNRAAAAVSAM
jgi:hypothetical protein